MPHPAVQGENCDGEMLKECPFCSSDANNLALQLDAGMHPAYEGLAALPYYDEFDLSTVDVLLISQYVPFSSNPSC